MIPKLILTKRNIPEVAAKTGRSEFELVKLLIHYNSIGRPQVFIPLYKEKAWYL